MRNLKLTTMMALIFLTLSLLSNRLPASGAAPADPVEPLVTGQGSARAGGLYLPFVSQPLIDLTISHLEITQAIQDELNGVPLVENRRTIARVFARTSGLDPIEGTTVSLSATRNGQALGTLMLGPAAVPPSPSRGEYASTFNAVLPDEWLKGEVTLMAIVDPDNVVPENDEDNNIHSVPVIFSAVPALDFKIVPINYTHAPTGTYFPYYSYYDEQILDHLMRVLPLHGIEVSHRAPIEFVGDLTTDAGWLALVEMVLNHKVADGSPPSQAYYGLVARANAAGNIYFPPWAGMGYIGVRAAVSVLEFGGPVVAHELGHNFGRLHAPCGNPGGPDPNYPHPDGSIGEYGLDVYEEVVWPPGPPQDTKDMMSYCNPAWVSDYTYRGIYDAQIASGRSSPDALSDVVLVRAVFEDSNIPLFRPTYTLTTRLTEASEESEFRLELVDAAGTTIAAHPVEFHEVAEGGRPMHALSAVVPRPDDKVARLRLSRSGEVLADHPLAPSAPAPEVGQVETSNDRLRVTWEASERPALVRYTADEGRSWITLAVDALGGNLLVDPATLPGDGYFEVVYGR